MNEKKVAILHTSKAFALRKSNDKTKTSTKSQLAIESGDIQAVIDSLPIKQKIFCEHFVNSLEVSASVLSAGYNTKNPSQMGAELMRKPAIRITIDALRAQRNKFSDVTKDFVLKKIVKTLEAAEEDRNHAATLRAAELLARHLGMFVERTEISGPDGEAIKYEKTEEDASDFTRSVASLAKRSRKVEEA